MSKAKSGGRESTGPGFPKCAGKTSVISELASGTGLLCQSVQGKEDAGRFRFRKECIQGDIQRRPPAGQKSSSLVMDTDSAGRVYLLYYSSVFVDA